MKLLIWKIRMILMKIRYPEAGYYERMCLVEGYTKNDIDNFVEEGIKEGIYEKNEPWVREAVCEVESYYWE